MSVETDLRKDGITVIEPLDEASVNLIVQSVSSAIYSNFSNCGFTYEELFERLSKIPMYIAEIPKGMSEASYFYKNSSIYFRDGMGLEDIKKYSIHEFIHNIQERKDKNGNLLRLGLCQFNGSEIKGMALNEAAVQIISSNIIGEIYENVEYYGLTFSTISSNIYPVICNLVSQMAYITGEDTLFDSTFNSNDHFKNKFISLCGEKAYNEIELNLDKILNEEEKIIKLENKLAEKDFRFDRAEKIMKKISNLKIEIKKIYFNTQETIINSYFNKVYSNLITETDVENFRKRLYSFQELIGTSSNYYFFNNFYINMMEKLDSKYDFITDNTYLIPKKENKLDKILNIIKKLLLIKTSEKE